MLGFAPIAANPLGAVSAVLVTIASPIEATGGIAFGGTADTADLSVFMSSTGGLTFDGSAIVIEGSRMQATGGLTLNGAPVWTAQAFKQATGGLVLNGNPFLSVAGKPIIITAVYQNFTLRGTP